MTEGSESSEECQMLADSRPRPVPVLGHVFQHLSQTNLVIPGSPSFHPSKNVKRDDVYSRILLDYVPGFAHMCYLEQFRVLVKATHQCSSFELNSQGRFRK